MKTTAAITNRLKPLVRVLFFLFIPGLFSQGMCSRNDDPEPEISDTIVGTWQLFNFTSQSTFSIEGSSGTIEMQSRNTTERNILVTFHADGTTTHWGGTFFYDFTFTLDGHSSTQTIESQPPIPEGKWRRVGDKLYVGHPLGGEQELDIRHLDDLQLFLGIKVNPIPALGLNDLWATTHFNRVD